MEKTKVYRQVKPKRDAQQAIEFLLPLFLVVFSIFAGLFVINPVNFQNCLGLTQNCLSL